MGSSKVEVAGCGDAEGESGWVMAKGGTGWTGSNDAVEVVGNESEIGGSDTK